MIMKVEKMEEERIALTNIIKFISYPQTIQQKTFIVIVGSYFLTRLVYKSFNTHLAQCLNSYHHATILYDELKKVKRDPKIVEKVVSERKTLKDYVARMVVRMVVLYGHISQILHRILEKIRQNQFLNSEELRFLLALSGSTSFLVLFSKLIWKIVVWLDQKFNLRLLFGLETNIPKTAKTLKRTVKRVVRKALAKVKEEPLIRLATENEKLVALVEKVIEMLTEEPEVIDLS